MLNADRSCFVGWRNRGWMVDWWEKACRIVTGYTKRAVTAANDAKPLEVRLATCKRRDIRHAVTRLQGDLRGCMRAHGDDNDDEKYYMY